MSREMIRQWSNRWNSFNPVKALVNVSYWKEMMSTGRIDPPLSISVDPCGCCCLKCSHCNAAKVINGGMMTKKSMDFLFCLLRGWRTKSVCIGGGGEPLMNSNTKYLITGFQKIGVESAVITNGIMLHNFIPEISYLAYLGVSVDAATRKTWNIVKGMDVKKDHPVSFERVLANIAEVRRRHGLLDLTYKYLALPTNYKEVYAAVKIAKELGCTNFHLRPGGAPWFKQVKSFEYPKRIRDNIGEQLDRARVDFEDDNFHVYGVVSKFGDSWKVNNSFKKCYAVFATCFVSPDGMIGLCCDRRGDKEIELCSLSKAVLEWGSEKHRRIHAGIKVSLCPRCTYSSTNEIFENFIICDRTFQNFY